jgi:hypothetical protein
VPDLDRDYFEERAEAELSMAQAAAHPAAVRAHYMMAAFYLDRLHFPDDAAVGISAGKIQPGRGRY